MMFQLRILRLLQIKCFSHIHIMEKKTQTINSNSNLSIREKQLNYLEIFFLGIFVYGVYEFTNHAILKNWKWKTVFMCTLWGGILFSSSVYIFRKITN